MIPNILRIETDNEIITLLVTEPGKLIEIDRIARPLDVEPPTEEPMILGGCKIYRMEFFAAPSITEATARNQSKKSRKLIAEFRWRTSEYTKRPAIAEIEIDRESMTRLHEILERNENGLWETVHLHRNQIKKKRHKSD